MKNVLCLTLCAALLFVATCVIPGGAVVLQVTVKGTVADVSLANNTLTISDPEQYRLRLRIRHICPGLFMDAAEHLNAHRHRPGRSGAPGVCQS